MRITNSMMVNNMMRNLGKNLGRMDKLQQNLATGKKFIAPSDDPIGVSRSLRLNTEVANLEQFKRNAEDAMSWLDTTEMATDNIMNVLQRARELTVQASNETNTVNERKAIAEEIEELREQLIKIGNSTYAGSYIFTGFMTNYPLFDGNGDYYFKNVPADPAQTLTSNEEIEFNVGIAERIDINFVGQRIFGTTAGGSTIDDPVDNTSPVSSGNSSQLIEVFDQLLIDLNASNTAGINSALTRIDIHVGNINAVRAEIGVKTNRLDLTLNRIEDDTLNMRGLLAKNEDADMAEVIMRLQMEENVYKASLSGGAKIIQPSLVDFLR
ncbi:MAG: flagellar hook-associated protein FlgL [Bacillota bacterium]